MTIRPFMLPNDLDTMNSLVMDGFQYPENPSWNIQEDEKEGMADRLRGAKRMWPVMRVMQVFFPSLRDIICGFIFEEDSKPVGLVNYMKPPGGPAEWMIVNVTVLPEYRHRGIARKLVESTIAELRKRQAQRALLDVIEDNLPAFNLYKELGFAPYATSTQYDFMPGTKITLPPLTDGWSVTPLPDSRWRIRYELALRATPDNVQQYEPISEKKFNTPFPMRIFGKLFESMSGMKNERVILCAPNGDVAGTAFYSVRMRSGGVNHANFEMDPKFSGMAAQFMGAILSKMLEAGPDHRISFEISGWERALIQAASDAECIKRFGAHRMGFIFTKN